MSAHIADTRFTFELPSLSYIDAKWEEPNLREAAASVPAVPARARKRILFAWLPQAISRFATWRRNSHAAAELALMSDRELLDIGLTPSDLPRVFDPAFNQDLRHRA